SLKIAEKFTDYIFTASGDSFKLKSKKVQVTGHGIDTKLFLPKSINKDIDLITVGRITSSKNLFALVDILEEIRKADDVALTIVGVGVTSEEKEYEAKLKSYVKEKKLSQFVHFLGRVEQVNLPDILNRARVFVTTAKNGSLDKAILEPMACGLPVVSMAKGSTSLPLGANQVTTKAEFATQTHKVLESKDFMIQDYVEYINTNHSLQSLVPNINETYAS
ncbi:MAG: glycosyltransferase, partial [Bdellovibrionales bacterium]|nr:glycosyltransferase [Bdellovibrionales bacterium]